MLLILCRLLAQSTLLIKGLIHFNLFELVWRSCRGVNRIGRVLELCQISPILLVIPVIHTILYTAFLFVTMPADVALEQSTGLGKAYRVVYFPQCF